MAQWHYASNGQQHGPVDEAQLRQMIAAGQLLATDLVWTEGMAQWQPAGEVAALRPAPQPVSVAPAAPYPYAPGSAAPVPYAQAQQSAKGLAVGGMVCALIGIFCGLVLGVVGIILSTIALNRMKKFGNNEGRGMALAGLIIGILDIPIGVGWILLNLHLR